MDRREFLKICAAMGLTVGIPGIVSVNCEPGVQLVELVSYDIDDRKLQEAITVGAVQFRDGRGWADCELNVNKAWRAVTFEDSRGRIWATANGERWTCGKEWFG